MQSPNEGRNSRAEAQPSDSKFSRRGALKHLGTGSIGLVAGSALFTGAVSADSTNYNPNYYWPERGSDRMKADYFACPNYGGRRISSSTCLLYWGSYKTVSGAWFHEFSASTHARCEDRDCNDNSWSPVSTLERIKYSFRSRNNSGSFVVKPVEGEIGADPAPNGGENEYYDDLIYTVLSEVASEASTVFNYALLARDIISALTNDRPDRTGSTVVYDWYYGGSTDRANTSYFFQVKSPNKYIDFDFEGLAREQEYNSFAASSWVVNGFARRKNTTTTLSNDTLSSENETDIQQRRPNQPVSVTRTASTKPQKVYLRDMNSARRERWEQRTDAPYVISQALPFEIARYSYTGGPDTVNQH